MSGIVDPSTPEREARENVTMCYHPSDFSEAEFLDACLDTYAAAVRARALADVAGWVEGMRLTGRKNVGRCTSKCGDGPCSHTAADFHNAALDALLAKLREAK